MNYVLRIIRSDNGATQVVNESEVMGHHYWDERIAVARALDAVALDIALGKIRYEDLTIHIQKERK